MRDDANEREVYKWAGSAYAAGGTFYGRLWHCCKLNANNSSHHRLQPGSASASASPLHGCGDEEILRLYNRAKGMQMARCVCLCVSVNMRSGWLVGSVCAFSQNAKQPCLRIKFLHILCDRAMRLCTEDKCRLRDKFPFLR